MNKESVLINQQNLLVKRWVPKVRSALKTTTNKFTKGKSTPFVMRGKQQELKLNKSIGSRTGQEYGAIEFVSFRFERHGVFVHKGVGRGYKMSGGFVTRYAKGPASPYRTPTAWFNPVINAYVPQLADAIADLNADATVNAMRLRIK